MNEASSDARKATTLAISSGRPERASGTSFTTESLVSPVAVPEIRANSVSM